MKLSIALLAVALSAPVAVYAQGGMKGMDMKSMDMKGMDQKSMPMEAKGHASYKATGTVKKVDKAKGTVTLAHGPVKELKWSSMTMPFGVEDKSVLDKLSSGKKVDFEFVQEGKNYVVTRVK